VGANASGSGHEPEAVLESWHRLLQFHARVIGELDRRLGLEHRISVREFDVLITLANAPGRRLPMKALADSVMLSGGGLTHLVDRLENASLVVRRVRDSDRRSVEAVLTDAGETRLREARATHDAVILGAMDGAFRMVWVDTDETNAR
jgi:DNA-binding MarR family transcriptional regulator